MEKQQKINVFVTPHSHYDYLWCDTPDRMGAKNARLIKEALLIMRKYPEYKYIIDSAMAVEYFKLNYPELMEELKQRVREQRIELMGGMVVAADTLLAGGECLVRQFLYGTRYFKEHFNVESRTGFLIDSFSMTPQLPQVLAKSGFRHLVFVRGAPKRNLPQEFFWKSFDGSKIFVHWMRINYSYVLPPFTGTILAPLYPFLPIPFTISIIPQTFKVHEILKRLFPPFKLLFQWIASINAGTALIGSDMGGLNFTIMHRAMQATTNNVLLLCGTDNLPPSSNVIDAIEYMRKKSKRYNVKLALPRDFFASVLNTRTRFGAMGPCEMTGYLDKFPGTFSARIGLKQRIRELENEFYVTEVLSMISSVYSGFLYPGQEISKSIWRVLRCCFHDGIPGCHIDAADDHLMKQLELSSRQLARISNSALFSMERAFDTIKFHENELPLLIFNPISMSRNDVATIKVSGDPKDFIVKDEQGEPVPSQTSSLASGGNEVVIACADIPPLGYKIYSITNQSNAGKNSLSGDENKQESVLINGDRLRVKGKRFELVFEKNKLQVIMDNNGQILTESKEYCINDLRIFNDKGDSYLTGKMPKKTFTTFGNALDIVEDGPVRTVVRITSKLRCKNKRFFKPTSIVLQYIILYHNDTPRIDFITRIENHARNIRIQACFPLNMAQPEFHSEVPYGYIKRDIEPVKGFSWATIKKTFEHYDRLFPVINWMDASDPVAGKGMTVMNLGLPENEIARNKDHLFLTLLRSTGYIGTLFPANVPQLLGPFYSIPKAYELTTHELKYSLFFHDGQVSHLSAEAMRCSVPLVARIMKKYHGDRSLNGSFLQLEPETFLVTAFKQSEAEPGEIIIRVLETSNASAEGIITFEHELDRARLLNLLEQPLQDLIIEEKYAIRFHSKPQEILTIGIKFTDSP
ncbi:MAG TPA: glycoside hydrolase family 38 C-terminal domain-containing protein [Candidatus Lokiarchaeia archaeon]|nr:glycoside hydrolase family 38 C-terminal domain-containing protein [Candidatus Lokiarchaeia archaeon]